MNVFTRRLSSSPTPDLERFAGNDGFLFTRDGSGVAARGRAATVNGRDAAVFLANLNVIDEVSESGSGPILLGAVPFDTNHDYELVLPEVLVYVSPTGESWITTVGDAEPDMSIDSPTPNRGGSYTVRSGVDVDHYLKAVETGRNAVREGVLTKVVIARDIFVECEHPIDVTTLLLRLKAAFGSCYRYSIDGLIGASPELLVSRDGTTISSHPLAGTTGRTGDPTVDERLARELLLSAKNQIEHRVVIDAVHDTLLPFCSYLDWEPEPNIIATANVQHLGTRLIGHLSEPRLNVLDAVHALSPTPALGGHPRGAALELIAKNEGFDRGRYGGAVGWVDQDGNGEFAVTIRCAELSDDRHTAHLFAGGGIVAESEPLAELAETQAKFQAMLAAIIRP